MPTMTIEMMINKGDKSADPVDQFSTTNNEPTYNYGGELAQLSPREFESAAGDDKIVGRKRSLSEGTSSNRKLFKFITNYQRMI